MVTIQHDLEASPLGPRLRLGSKVLEALLPDLALGLKLIFHRFGKQSFPFVGAQAEPGCQNVIRSVSNQLNSYVSRSHALRL